MLLYAVQHLLQVGYEHVMVFCEAGRWAEVMSYSRSVPVRDPVSSWSFFSLPRKHRRTHVGIANFRLPWELVWTTISSERRHPYLPTINFVWVRKIIFAVLRNLVHLNSYNLYIMAFQSYFPLSNWHKFSKDIKWRQLD